VVLADRRFVLYLLALLINSTVYIQYVSTLPLALEAAGPSQSSGTASRSPTQTTEEEGETEVAGGGA
jgi:hypothetical protein